MNDGGKLMILTLPEKSDHYKIALRQIYPKFNYAQYIINFYKNIGLDVNVKKFKMRMYVGDILSAKSLLILKYFTDLFTILILSQAILKAENF